MRTTKIITLTLLLATLATGCSKDKKSPIRLFSERFTSDSKVWIDPTDLVNTAAEWIPGETVNVNIDGTDASTYTIAQVPYNEGTCYILRDGEGQDLQIPESGQTYYAVYPGSKYNDDADVEITNGNGTTDPTIIRINRLGVRFVDGGGHKIAFPMAAKTIAQTERLLFYHLSAGFKVKIDNHTASSVNIASLRIIAQSDQEVQPIPGVVPGFNVYAVWVPQGPSIPFSEIGSGENWDATHRSDMMFDLYNGSNSNPGYSIAANNGSLTFCVPVTINRVQNFAIIGYDPNGVELFRKYKSIASGDDIIEPEANKMYTIPTITLE